MSTDIGVIHAYRHLYRGLMHAVQFSKPSRYIVTARLRAAFREKGATYDPRTTGRTIRFLEAAARERGLEHKVLKNLTMIAYWRYHATPGFKGLSKKRKQEGFEKVMEDTAFKHYDLTVAMLNKSMGLCLR